MGGLYSKILINALPIKGTVYSQYHNGLGAPRSPSRRQEVLGSGIVSRMAL